MSITPITEHKVENNYKVSANILLAFHDSFTTKLVRDANVQTLNLFQKQPLLKHKRYQVGGNEYFMNAFKDEICWRKLWALSSFLTSELFKSVFKDSLSLRSESRDFSFAERRIKSVDLLCAPPTLSVVIRKRFYPPFSELGYGILFYCIREKYCERITDVLSMKDNKYIQTDILFSWNK